MTSCRAVALCPVGQMTETSYPPFTRVVASFQTRRSNGTGKFSTMIRTRFARKGSPTDAIILSIELAEVANANQVDHELIRPDPLGKAVELSVSIADHDDLAMRERLVEGFDQKRRHVRDHAKQIIAIGADELGEADVPIEDADVIALADQALDQFQNRAFAQIVGASLEAHAENADRPFAGLSDHVE